MMQTKISNTNKHRAPNKIGSSKTNQFRGLKEIKVTFTILNILNIVHSSSYSNFLYEKQFVTNYVSLH